MDPTITTIQSSKPWYKSKTLWFNLIGGIGAVAVIGGFDLGLTPETQAKAAAGILAVVNFALRFLTTQGLVK